MDKLQLLTKKIQKSVPAIMEWQDGALVHFEWYSSYTDESGTEHFSEEPDEFETGIILGDEILGKSNGGNGDICCMDLTKDDFKDGVYEVGVGNVWEYTRGEILGRDINIGDIMIVLDSLNINYTVNSTSIHIFESDYDDEPKCYDLKPAKNLQDQGRSTMNLLFDLICKE